MNVDRLPELPEGMTEIVRVKNCLGYKEFEIPRFFNEKLQVKVEEECKKNLLAILEF